MPFRLEITARWFEQAARLVAKRAFDGKSDVERREFEDQRQRVAGAFDSIANHLRALQVDRAVPRLRAAHPPVPVHHFDCQLLAAITWIHEREPSVAHEDGYRLHLKDLKDELIRLRMGR